MWNSSGVCTNIEDLSVVQKASDTTKLKLLGDIITTTKSCPEQSYQSALNSDECIKNGTGGAGSYDAQNAKITTAMTFFSKLSGHTITGDLQWNGHSCVKPYRIIANPCTGSLENISNISPPYNQQNQLDMPSTVRQYYDAD